MFIKVFNILNHFKGRSKLITRTQIKNNRKKSPMQVLFAHAPIKIKMNNTKTRVNVGMYLSTYLKGEKDTEKYIIEEILEPEP